MEMIEWNSENRMKHLCDGFVWTLPVNEAKIVVKEVR